MGTRGQGARWGLDGFRVLVLADPDEEVSRGLLAEFHCISYVREGIVFGFLSVWTLFSCVNCGNFVSFLFM